MRLPEFIIGGAPRSGTTWLYRLLERHPGIFLAAPLSPEPKFFLVDHTYQRGLTYYADTWFASALADRVAGEKSTNYLESAAAAERIARDLPRVKLVFSLRNPVERAYSNYCWSRMNGLESEDFPTALSLEEQRSRALPDHLKFAKPYAYFSRGLYADLLKPYVDRFPAAHILVLRFEDIVERPRMIAERLHTFLCVPPRPEDAEGLAAVNASDKTGDGLTVEVARSLAERYVEPNRRLSAMLGASFQSWVH